MRKFIFKVTAFSLIIITCFFLVLSSADGFTDDWYIKFTTSRQESLILGTSRAAQGLKPDVFNTICNVNMFNFAFTITQSPYGKTYLNSIKNKIKEGNRAGVFILTIDPWSISSITENPNDSVNFRETSLCLGNTENVNVNPNFEYLINNLGGNYWEIIARKYVNGSKFLHKNGWLEVSVPMDSATVNKRINEKVKSYAKSSKHYNSSTLRLHYLKKTIDFLNNYGDVYLVRLPMHPRIMEVENELMPDFNDEIADIIPIAKGYFDMTSLNGEFSYTDGNHLHKSSSKIVSEKIARWINVK